MIPNRYLYEKRWLYAEIAQFIFNKFKSGYSAQEIDRMVKSKYKGIKTERVSSIIHNIKRGLRYDREVDCLLYCTKCKKEYYKAEKIIINYLHDPFYDQRHEFEPCDCGNKLSY